MIANKEVLALADTRRAKLVFQYPMATWPDADKIPPIDSVTDATTAVSATTNNDKPVNITLQVWAKPLTPVTTAVSAPKIAVVIFNRGTQPASLNLTWSMVGTSEHCESRGEGFVGTREQSTAGPRSHDDH